LCILIEADENSVSFPSVFFMRAGIYIIICSIELFFINIITFRLVIVEYYVYNCAALFVHLAALQMISVRRNSILCSCDSTHDGTTNKALFEGSTC